jgi:hypothetical protein
MHEGRRGSAVELTLSDEEADTLRRALGSYLSDLRMEIRGTERREVRARLKRDKGQLNGLLDRLPPVHPEPMAGG